MPGSKLRETQKPTAAIRQRTLNFRLRLNLISRLVTQSQSCEWLPKLQNPRRNQYKPSHIIWVYKLYGSQTVLFIANQNWSRELILICTCSIICDIQSIVKTRSIDFSLSELLMLLFTPFSVTSLWKTTETKPSRYTAQCISYSLQFSWSVSEKSFPQSTSPTCGTHSSRKDFFRHDLIQIPNLEISLCFPSLVFLGNILSLIIQFFSFCKANLHFYQAPVKIHF